MQEIVRLLVDEPAGVRIVLIQLGEIALCRPMQLLGIIRLVRIQLRGKCWQPRQFAAVENHRVFGQLVCQQG